MSMSTWPRVTLRIEDGPHGSTLAFEARPFYSMALMALVMLWTLSDGFAVYVVLACMAFVLACYGLLMPYDLKRINRLPSIRRALAPMGLRVCDHCGYDLFMQESSKVCPECGRDASGPPA
jgi:hypothetical protein